MNDVVPFQPMIFPVFGAEWLVSIEANARQIGAYLAVRHSYEQLRRRKDLERLVKWQDRLRSMLHEAECDLFETQTDLAFRLCCRDVVVAANELGINRKMLCMFWGACVWKTAIDVRWDEVDRCQRQDPTTRDFAGADNLSSQIRDGIYREACRRLKNGGLAHDARASLVWVRDWSVGVDDDRLRGMFVDTHDRELWDVLRAGQIDSGPLSLDSVQQLRERANALAAERNRRQDTYTAITGRTRRISDHVLAPLIAVFLTEKDYGVGSLLCWSYGQSIVSAIELAPAPLRLALSPEHISKLKTACVDPLFWYIGLYGLLRESGATLGFGFRSWVVGLLCATLAHPSKVRQMGVPKEARRTRLMLAKRVAPMLKGYPLDDRKVEQLREIGRTDAIALIVLVSALLADVACQENGAVDFRNDRHRKVVEDLWQGVIGPHVGEILAWMAVNMKAANELREAVDHRDDPEVWQWEPQDLAAGPAQADEAIEVEAEKWFFVPNPAAEVPTLVPIELPVEGRAEAFSEFLRGQRVNVVVKPHSILGALDYFRDMPALLRAQTPYDDLNGQRWHKLKRGAQRIYVRIEPDGRLLFHPYMRRDWRSEWLTTAA